MSPFSSISLIHLALVSVGGAVQQTPKAPPKAPILRIEAGGHTSSVTSIAVDPAGKFVITASNDKSARVWELPSLKLVRVLRPPLGLTPEEGKLNAVALSPNGKIAAVGGWTGVEWDESNSVYMFDVSTGRIVQRFAGLPNAIDSLAFSRDGLRLAVGLADGGLRVLNAADGSLLVQDDMYSDAINSLDFDLHGQLVTCSEDGSVRIYNDQGSLRALVARPPGSRPEGVAFSPDGTRVAVGDATKASVVVLSGSNLQEEFTANTEGLGASVQNVAWSPDGTSLSAAASATNSDHRFIVRTWSEGGNGVSKDVAVAGNTVLALAYTPAGGLVFSAGDGFGTMSAAGEVKRVDLPIADLSDLGTHFRLTKDGGQVWFSYRAHGKEPVSFSTTARTIVSDPVEDARLAAAPPKRETAGFKVTDWFDNQHPKMNGTPITLDPFEVSESLAILPDGGGFVLGTEWYVRSFGSDGSAKWKIDTHGSAMSVNISGDGRLVVVAYGDGTVRWHRVRDGKELLALYAHPDKKRWVIWTPSGYYDCSPDGENLFGWSVNNGADLAAGFYPPSSLRSRYYRPDVISRILSSMDEAAAVRDANAHRKS